MQSTFFLIFVFLQRWFGGEAKNYHELRGKVARFYVRMAGQSKIRTIKFPQAIYFVVAGRIFDGTLCAIKIMPSQMRVFGDVGVGNTRDVDHTSNYCGSVPAKCLHIYLVLAVIASDI